MSENPSNHNKKRVLLVDDHPVLRKGLVRLIDSKNGFVVCGEAGSATEAMALMHELKPHLVIVDIGLPGASGIELTKTIRAQFPNIPVLILSMHEEALYASRALRAGAVGYIVKQDAIDNIATALQQTLQGQRYLSPSIAKQFQADGSQDQPQSSHDLIASLTDRELEIFQLIGKGRDVREMAQALNVSPKTVETHRTNIKEKLKLKNSREVARIALQWISEHPS
ncbi:MAG TPA: response regulator transcription factor [Chthoniobacterales bacterium]|jgi:DNA-binding NarL/FixJ family response regulator|nr:response regulator transcription factor [Chthoniobacterales bacterium]